MLFHFCRKLFPCRSARVSLALSLLAIPLLGLLATPALAQRTINIPGDQPTIQAGINAANNGDTVLVAPGTYYENIDFSGKAITVTSSAGSATTFLRSSTALQSAVTFQTGELRSSTLQGFTITNSNIGGAIFLKGSSPTISGNIFANNTCTVIEGNGASPLIQNNQIIDTVVGSGCQSLGTLGMSFGFSDHRTPTLAIEVISNTITQNAFDGPNGSAIFVFDDALAYIIGNRITRNTANGYGSALNLGGLYVSIFAANNVIADNTSTSYGAVKLGADSNGTMDIAFVNNTVVDNVQFAASSNASQISFEDLTYGPHNGLLVANNVVHGKSTNQLVDCGHSYGQDSNTPSGNSTRLEHNVLYNAGGGPIFNNVCRGVAHDWKDVIADPMFVDLPGGDYHLAPSSPAIDVGVNSVVEAASTYFNYTFAQDFDGNARITTATNGPAIMDAGAYEYGSGPDRPGALLNLSADPSVLINGTGNGQAVTLVVTATSNSGTPQGTIRIVHKEGDSPASVQLDANGKAVIVTPPLTGGVNSFVAYCDNCTPTPAESIILPFLVSGPIKASTTITVSSSQNPAPVGTAVQLTATLTSEAGNPTGVVSFSEGSLTYGTASLSSGVANLTLPTSILRGAHAITIAYAGDGTVPPASTSFLQTITGAISTTTLTTSANNVPANTPIALSATTAAGSVAPDLSKLQILDGTTPLRPLAVAANGVTATVTLAPGTHILTAVFGGDSYNEPSTSAPVTVVVQGASTTTTLSADPAQPTAFHAFYAVSSTTATTGTPHGTVTLTADGQQVSSGSVGGAITLTSRALLSLPAGQHTLVETYTPADATTLPSSATLLLNVSRSLVSLNTGSAPAPFPQSQPATVTASIDDGTGRHLASGTITPVIDGAAQSAISLTAAGQVSVLLQGLSIGTHSITFTYSGDANFLPATTAAVQFTVLQRDFALKHDTSLTMAAGTYVVRTLTLTSIGGFTDAVTLSCDNLPLSASCRFEHSPVPMSAGGTATVQFAVDTSALPGYQQSAALRNSTRGGATTRLAGLLCPIAGFAGLFLLRARRRFAVTGMLLLAFAALGVAAALTGCSGQLPAYTPPGTYAIRITGTSPGIVHSQTVALQVTAPQK